MKKYWGIHSIFIGFMFLFAWTVFADQQPKQDLKAAQKQLDLLTEVVEKAGAQTERIQLHYGNTHKTFDHLEEVKDFAEKLGVQMGLTEKGTDNHQSSEFHFSRLKENVLTELQVTAMPSHIHPGAWDSYLIVNITADSKGLKSVREELSRVHKVLEGMQILPQFYTCVQGNLNGTLENDVQLEIMNNILHDLGAEVVESVEDSTVKSFSAYTSRLSGYILTNGRKMNVQAGMHVDQLQGITRVTIGTPIIAIEY